jgi:hypothetical protein
VRLSVRPSDVSDIYRYSIHIVQALTRHDESELLTSIFRDRDLDDLGASQNTAQPAVPFLFPWGRV